MTEYYVGTGILTLDKIADRHGFLITKKRKSHQHEVQDLLLQFAADSWPMTGVSEDKLVASRSNELQREGITAASLGDFIDGGRKQRFANTICTDEYLREQRRRYDERRVQRKAERRDREDRRRRLREEADDALANL